MIQVEATEIRSKILRKVKSISAPNFLLFSTPESCAGSGISDQPKGASAWERGVSPDAVSFIHRLLRFTQITQTYTD